MPTLSTLADVTRSLATPGAVYVERYGSGSTNSEGVYVEGGKTTTLMSEGIVHPISGRDRVLLPDGVRTRETIVTYTTDVLKTTTESGSRADVLIHTPSGGTSTRYTVQTAENWAHATGHFRVFATREAAS